MHPRLQKLLLVVSDFLAQLTAFAIGAWCLTVYGNYSSLENLGGWWSSTGEIHSLVHLIFIFLVIFRFYMKGLYSRRVPFWDELRAFLGTIVYLALLHGMVVLIAKWPFSRVLWVMSWTATALCIPVFRALTRALLDRASYWKRPSVIIGSGETALSTFRALRGEPQLGYRILEFVGFDLFQNPQDWPTDIPRKTIAPEKLHRELYEISKTHANLQILVALEQSDSSRASELLERLSLHFENLYFIPPLIGLPLFGMDINHFFSHELLLLQSRSSLGFRPRYLLKRVFDLVVSSILIILLSPLLLFIAFSIRRSGPGVFFKQARWGYRGQKFVCYKFRTMIPNAEQVLKDLLAQDPVARREWEEKTKITNDPRVTRIGDFLRKTSLDELPQLFNVLKGEMSLVGPRPILLHESEKYGARLDFYHNVRPGLTGLWQVSGRSDTDYENRIRLDTWYVKNWSLWYDIAILFKTVHVVLNRRGAY